MLLTHILFIVLLAYYYWNEAANWTQWDQPALQTPEAGQQAAMGQPTGSGVGNAMIHEGLQRMPVKFTSETTSGAGWVTLDATAKEGPKFFEPVQVLGFRAFQNGRPLCAG